MQSACQEKWVVGQSVIDSQKLDDMLIVEEIEERWIREMVPAFREKAAAESFHVVVDGEKAWNRSENAFIAEVSVAVDRLEASLSEIHPPLRKS